MPLRALFAIIVTAFLLFTGAFLMLRAQDASLAAFFTSLFLQNETNRVLCFVLALGALLSGLFALLSAFVFFGDDDVEYDDNRFPFGAIPFFLLASLGFFWFAVGCENKVVYETVAPEQTLADILPPAEPDPNEIALGESAPFDDPPPLEAPAIVVETPPPAPSAHQFAGGAAWPYKYPLIQNGAYANSTAVQQFLSDLFAQDDPDSALSNALCGKAWVALSGASSQEGPASRNQLRSRYRAELAAKKARDWISAQPQACGRPVVLTVDLGQHQATVSNPGNGAATDYQREVLIVSRPLATDEAPSDGAAAVLELQAFLDDPKRRQTLIGNRQYRHAPKISPLVGDF